MICTLIIDIVKMYSFYTLNLYIIHNKNDLPYRRFRSFYHEQS